MRHRIPVSWRSASIAAVLLTHGAPAIATRLNTSPALGEHGNAIGMNGFRTVSDIHVITIPGAAPSGNIGVPVPPNMQNAVATMLANAQRGDVNSQLLVGSWFLLGQFGMPKDPGQAVFWLTQAAEQGNVTAQTNLGLLYRTGAIPKDEAKSNFWYGKAVAQYRAKAEQGSGIDQYQLGVMYRQGLGLPKDNEQALIWLRKAVARQDGAAGLANSEIRQIEQEGAPPPPAPPDFDAVRAKAESGDAAAQTRLGLLYIDDKSPLKDLTLGANWIRKAAAQGDADAEDAMSDLSFSGNGVARDQAQALGWLRKAAEHGRAESQYALSSFYWTGMFGAPRDFAESVKWLRAAADQGHVKAQNLLALAYGNGDRGLPKDPVQAAAWYQKAAEQGDATAQFQLAGLYDFGTGVPTDKARALTWYRKAAAQEFALQGLAKKSVAMLEKQGVDDRVNK
jgi:TPR repeat protein